MQSSCKENESCRQPLVSVIMPVYNTGIYLHEAIDSILSQTYKNWELIIVNDGSTDDSPTIINSYKDERIRIIHQENQGLSMTRNNAMKVAKGEFVYFIDSDDVIEAELIETCVSRIGNNDFVFFNADTMGDKASPWQTYAMADLFDEERSFKGSDVVNQSLDKYAWRSPVWLLFIRRSYIEGLSLTFYPGILHEDQLYSGTLFIESEKCCALHKALVHHRIRNNSIMGVSFSLRNVECYAIVCAELRRLKLPTANRLAEYTLSNSLLTAKRLAFGKRFTCIRILKKNNLLQHCSLKQILRLIF